MDELHTLKERLQLGDISGALSIVDELEEMSRNSIILNIESYMRVLLLHLIKKQAQAKTTTSWEISIRNSSRNIFNLNNRSSTRNPILKPEQLQAALESNFDESLQDAALETEDLSLIALEGLIDRRMILDQALQILQTGHYPSTQD
jgi:hypothetical protein